MKNNRREFRPGDIIVHFKRYYPGDHRDDANSLQYIYRYDGTVKNTETGEMMVTYTSLYDDNECDMGWHFARPKDMFYEEVDTTKYPDSKQKYRFEIMNEVDLGPLYINGQAMIDSEFKAYRIAQAISRALTELDDDYVFG